MNSLELFMKLNILSLAVTTTLLFGTSALLTNAQAASVEEIASISVNKDGSNFKYWNENSPLLKDLKAYVKDVTDEKSKNFIPVADRIAVSDLDGTIFSEQTPIYNEWVFYFHRVFDDPNYKADPVLKAFTERCLEAIKKSGNAPESINNGENYSLAAAFEGMEVEEYQQYVRDFATKTDADGLSNLKIAESFFLPMVEIISYLKANDFNFYIVTGSDRYFARGVLETIPSIGSDHVIGKDVTTLTERQQKYESTDAIKIVPDDVLVRGNYYLSDDQMYKVVNIVREIGKRPVFAMGNSGGDQSMLNYTMGHKKYQSFTIGVLNDDDKRDFGSEQKGAKMKALCDEFGWHGVSMAKEFKTIFGENVKKQASLKFKE